jgi:hypothetical protein
MEEVLDKVGALETDETNRSGNYMVNIKFKKELPRLLPIMGKKININYPGIQRLCLTALDVIQNLDTNQGRCNGLIIL